MIKRNRMHKIDSHIDLTHTVRQLWKGGLRVQMLKLSLC